MSFKKLLRAQVSNLMSIMANGEIAVPASYFSYTGQSYNPSTRTNAPTYATAEPVNVIFSALTEEEGIPSETTSKVLVAAADITVTPKEQDKITALSQVWFVDKIMGVPGESIYILKVVRDSV